MKNTKIVKQAGFSLIELMIAVLVSIIVLLGLVTVFETSANLNRTQNGLARLQENGRFAMMNLKQSIEQAGYQGCLSSSYKGESMNTSPRKLPWLVYMNTPPSGIPNRAQVSVTAASADPDPYYFDPAYLIHGHECTAGACAPSLTSLGSDTSFTVPAVGTGDGQRIAGTDVLSFRYIETLGVEVQSTTGAQLNLAPGATNSVTSGNPVLVVNCEPLQLKASLVTATAITPTTVTLNPTIEANAGANSRIFDMVNDVKHKTIYVANNVVDGRDVPTLYVAINGQSNALIEGVDRFDLMYGVKDAQGNVLYLDANGVETLAPNQCFNPPYAELGINGRLVNTTGCGWRSVVSIEVHLLLNTVNNSTTSNTEAFFYSLTGEDAESPSDLASGINHYNMSRREFVSNISLKNNN